MYKLKKAIVLLVILLTANGCANKTYLGEYVDQRVDKNPQSYSIISPKLVKRVSYENIDPDGNMLIENELKRLINDNQKRVVSVSSGDVVEQIATIKSKYPISSQLIRVDANIFVGGSKSIYRYEPSFVPKMTKDGKVVLFDENSGLDAEALGLCDTVFEKGRCSSLPNISFDDKKPAEVVRTVEYYVGDFSISVIDISSEKKVFTTKYVGSVRFSSESAADQVKALSKAVLDVLVKNKLIPE